VEELVAVRKMKTRLRHNFGSLLGKWKLDKYVFTREFTDGREKVSVWHAEDHAVNIVWDFKSGGVFTAWYGTKELPGKWDLKVQKVNAGIIKNATLTLSGQAAKRGSPDRFRKGYIGR
jgi:hypothetical protein